MATGAKNKAEPQQAPKPVREKQRPELRVTGASAWAPCAGSARTALHTRLYLRGWRASELETPGGADVRRASRGCGAGSSPLGTRTPVSGEPH